MQTILIIEDDETIANIEKDYLEVNDFDVTICGDALSGINALTKRAFDLIILDLMLPGMDGFSACKKMRTLVDIPILIVSAKHESSDQILGLGLGADNFITKPFDPNVLVAMVKANLAGYERSRKEKTADDDSLRIGPFSLTPSTRIISKEDKALTLTNKEYELLAFFLRNKDIVFTKEDLYEEIWGLDSDGDTTTVAVHVNRLRQKIEDNPSHPIYLLTVWSVGYRFTVPV
ncbi:DNA-binding response regulator, OmpR family, contains REC and winged-helix (wHTH) domain [Lachnospiraceae bacterium XBB1006]|nr:DNA-binding response regulator, OmpR family, contains REC and winged-helix (wHTH) domain [Lachnospiraceae bacterium XBB1006]